MYGLPPLPPLSRLRELLGIPRVPSKCAKLPRLFEKRLRKAASGCSAMRMNPDKGITKGTAL